MADKPETTEPQVQDQGKPDKGPKLVRLNLKYEFKTHNVLQPDGGYATLVHGPGKVEVEEAVAEDLLRREAEYDKLERERLESKDITVDVSAQTGTIFSGAGVDVTKL